MRPGKNVNIQTQLPPNTPPINSGTWGVAGITTQGPVGPVPGSSISAWQDLLCTSFAQWQGLYGGRGTNPLLSDSVETYFAQGGSAIYTARVVGPGAVNASVSLKDSSNANSCTVTALGPGAYANGFQVIVAAVTGGGYTISIENSSGAVLETSNVLNTVTDAVSYGQTSAYVTVVATGVNPPAVVSTALAGGVDDLADISTTQYANAINSFPRSLGPMQVSVPGVTTTAVLTAVANHCYTAGPPGFRVGVGDLPDTSVAATLIGDAAPITALGPAARSMALFTPWADIAPVTGTTGLRAVPPSAFYAGLAAYSDASSVTPRLPVGNPNLPIAGKNGTLSTAVDLHQTFFDTDRQSLNTAGINVIKPVGAGYRIYGNVTSVNRLTDPLYYMLSNVRLDMVILAQCDAIQEDHMFDELDGLGLDVAAYGADLVNMMTEWQAGGALFPNPQGVFFLVDTSGDVNTPTTESEGELLGTIAYARAPGAEQVNLNIVRASAATGV